MSVSVTMPQLGESVTEGTVTRWLKKEGEHVTADEPLLEVSTDKVDTEIPSPAAGILRGIAVDEDETVAVGAELAVIDEDEGAGQRARPGPAGPPAAGRARVPRPDRRRPRPSRARARRGRGGPGEPSRLPRPGARRRPGPGRPRRQHRRRLSRRLLPGSALRPRRPRRLPAAAGSGTPPSAPPASPFQGRRCPRRTSRLRPSLRRPGSARGYPAAVRSGRPASAQLPRPRRPARGRRRGSGGRRSGRGHRSAVVLARPDGPYVTPLVRKLAAEHGVDLGQVSGTGVGGRIRKQDVLDAARARRDAAAAQAPQVPARRARRPGRAAPPARRGRRPAGMVPSACAAPPSTCHGLARSSPSGWWSRCRPRRSSPPWSRRTSPKIARLRQRAKADVRGARGRAS